MTNRITLPEGVGPKIQIDRGMFEDQVTDGKYWGIPERFFERDGVAITLAFDLPQDFEWLELEETNGIKHLCAAPQDICLDGEVYGINPGMFPCTVDASELSSNPSVDQLISQWTAGDLGIDDADKIIETDPETIEATFSGADGDLILTYSLSADITYRTDTDPTRTLDIMEA